MTTSTATPPATAGADQASSPVSATPSETDATRVLHRAHRWTRSYSWWGERCRDGWFLRFAPGPAPAGAPSWMVMDSGLLAPVHQDDALSDVVERLTAPVGSL